MKIIKENRHTITFKDLLMGQIFESEGKYYYKIGYSNELNNAVYISEYEDLQNEPDPRELVYTFADNVPVNSVNAELHIRRWEE